VLIESARAVGPELPALRATGLRKAFAGVVAVDDVDLRVDAGSICGLLGPNGAGKTTVLSMLFGLLPADAGTVELLGRRPTGDPGDLDGVAGFVEAPRFYPYLDGRANLRGLATLDGAPADARISELLAEVGLAGTDGLKLKGYSLGMRQRLGIAAALLRRPRLLVLDEPANGLDPAGLRDLRALLVRLAADGVGVLLSSHDMPTVEALCDQVSVMRAGRVVFAGTMDAMRAEAPDPAYRVETSDDDAALVEAAGFGVVAARHDEGGLAVTAGRDQLDAWVVSLGRMGVAVRALTLVTTSLESLFFALTEGPPAPPGRARVLTTLHKEPA
jgi:ABC-2 type transport system ATP-binding protein